MLTAAAAPPGPGEPLGVGAGGTETQTRRAPGGPWVLGGPSWVPRGLRGSLLGVPRSWGCPPVRGVPHGCLPAGGSPSDCASLQRGLRRCSEEGLTCFHGKKRVLFTGPLQCLQLRRRRRMGFGGGIGCFSPRLRGGSEELQLDIKFQAGERRQRLKAGVMASSSPSLSFQLPGTKTPILRENSCQQIPKSPNSSPVSPAPAGRWLAKAVRR